MDLQDSKSLFLAPRSVVFVGVPRKSGPGSFNPVDHLRQWGYQGEIHLVHPHVREIAGLPVLESVSSMDKPADLAVISTPRETVPGVVEECTKKGIRALIVTNQGFSEADAKGRELQQAMVKEAERYGARIMGPNTLGAINAFDRFTTSFMPLEREELPVGLVCQSGVFFVGSPQLIGGVGVGVDLGNSCDVDLVDAIEWLGSDTRLRCLAVHAEEVSGGRRFFSAAREVSIRIPVVLLKTGRSPEGARAASSHSGSMAGEDAIVDAAARKAGLIRVHETEDVIDLMRGFLRLPPMRGGKVAIVTLTGAGGIILLDTLHECGLETATLSDDTLRRLRELSPPWMPLGNPVDIWPALMKHGMQRVYKLVLEDVLRDPEVDGVLCVALGVAPAEQAHLTATEVIQECSEKADKPVVVWFYGSHGQEAQAQVEKHGRALAVPSLERGVRLLARMAWYERWKNSVACS